MVIGEHLVASTRGRVRSLLRPEQARWLWARLRANLPHAFACTLMPDHLHVFAAVGAHPVLIRVLAAFTTRFGVRFDVLDAEPAHSPEIAHRMMRYVLLNPVRERLVDDPWRWRWSTLRDLAGAAHPTWTPIDRAATALEIPAERLLRALTWTADARPVVPVACPVVAASLVGVRAAVCATLRIEDADLHDDALARTLVVQTADAITRIDATLLAAELGCSRRTIFRDRAARHPAVAAVLLCLCDPGSTARSVPRSRSLAARPRRNCTPSDGRLTSRRTSSCTRAGSR